MTRTASASAALNEFARLATLVVKHPREAFHSSGRIAAEWQSLNFTAPPDLDRAIAEYDAFVEILSTSGAEIRKLPDRAGTGLDSIYVRDASIVTPHGVVIGRMGKAERQGEPAAQAEAFAAWQIPILGAIRAPGTIEGGDLVWLSDRVVAVGRGYRTNDDGIAQLRSLLGESIDELIVVPLPHWRGTGDVFHLMSMLSPVDRDLAVVYSPLLPVPFRERLLTLGYSFVEVPDSEFDTMGANVLAIAPRDCVMVEGSPLTRSALERAGAVVRVYSGVEISLKGGGGPTCLTRPIGRGTGGSGGSGGL